MNANNTAGRMLIIIADSIYISSRIKRANANIKKALTLMNALLNYVSRI